MTKILFSAKAAKFWVAAVAAVAITVLSAVEGAVTDGITTQEWLTIAIALFGAIAVYATPNAE